MKKLQILALFAIVCLSTSGPLSASSIFGDSANIYGVSSGEVRTREQRGAFLDKWENMTPEQVKSITIDQIKSVEGEDLKSLTIEQVQALTPEQLQALTSDQLAWFSSEKLESFTPTQLGAFLPGQIKYLITKRKADEKTMADYMANRKFGYTA